MIPIDIKGFEQLKASGNLPSPKGVALAILRATQREDASFSELARIIKSDPAFVGRLIKSANSVNAHPGRPVVSVQDALVVLGMPAVRNLALGFSLLSQYRQGACRSFDYAAFWSSSLATALAFQVLTLRTRAAQPEESFSVGLLARIGELALATLYPKEYAEVLDQARDGGEGLPAREHAILGIDHCELTAAMLADWGIPKIFTEPARHHEDRDEGAFPADSRQAVLRRSLALARSFADICLRSGDERAALMPRLFALGRQLSIEAEELQAMCDGTVKQWLEWGVMLGVAAQSVPSFQELARRPQPAPEAAAARPDRAGADAAPLRLLIVDDEEALRMALQAILGESGYEVREAASGEEALAIALDFQPHMMIVDWLMPGMDGLALTRALRQTRGGRGVYILFLTSVDKEAKLIEALDAGADDFLSKPLNPRLLAARLRAGQRIVRLQLELERDREAMQRMAADLALGNRRLQEVALTDALTGVPNRRYAMERMQQEWARAARAHRPLSCMVVDLDEFKQINDRHGHDVGDEYLKQVAAAIRAGVRAHDVVCRTGGDEFLVVSPDTDLPAALACAERVRQSVEAATVVAGGLKLKPTLSVGVATRDAETADVGALIKRADQALYLAKQRGRNRAAAVQGVA